MKIAIIGNPGSGKSTLSLKLHKMLEIPLYHLDQYFWKPDWQEPDRNEFEKIHNKLCDQESWIIEGVATRFFEYRIQKADVVIFLDTPTYLCLYRIFKRAFTHYGKVYFSSAQGCPERGPDFKFLQFIWHFNRAKKPHIEALMQKYANQKKMFIIKNVAELHEFLNTELKKCSGESSYTIPASSRFTTSRLEEEI
jgi:adenylate kinase family enzyme